MLNLNPPRSYSESADRERMMRDHLPREVITVIENITDPKIRIPTFMEERITPDTPILSAVELSVNEGWDGGSGNNALGYGAITIYTASESTYAGKPRGASFQTCIFNKYITLIRRCLRSNNGFEVLYDTESDDSMDIVLVAKDCMKDIVVAKPQYAGDYSLIISRKRGLFDERRSSFNGKPLSINDNTFVLTNGFMLVYGIRGIGLSSDGLRDMLSKVIDGKDAVSSIILDCLI
jgi:hypothetical protein